MLPVRCMGMLESGLIFQNELDVESSDVSFAAQSVSV